MRKSNILIIEDDDDIREGIRILLENEGYYIKEACEGQQGLDILDEKTDLVILDIMMPGMNGLRTCEEIRKISIVPILFLTAKSQESDKLIGLIAGGDDYLTKPFSYSELLGRVKALLRRYQVYKGKVEESEEIEEKFIELSGVKINEGFNEVHMNGEEKELSNIEYNILLLMMRNPGRVFSAQHIYEKIWNEPYFYNCSNTVMVHIRNLRVKIEKDPKKPEIIKTVWGKGYKFELHGR
ncbi:MAG: response regulator transcription factor [Firmicutes bacterium]|nr:response regulator transcription factor [Bacillota bacterium]